MEMDFDTLKEILRKHELWLNQEAGREQANLHRADLRGICFRGTDLSGANLYAADLYAADLSRADLSGANLSEANLRGAKLYRANLSRADLSGANLSGADLREANLYRANLYGANLSGAYLSGTDLSGADLSIPMTCPEIGSFIGWKKVRSDLIVKLLIPEDAKRSSATGRKCRCNKAKVIAIETLEGETGPNIAYSKYDSYFEYKVGEIVSVDNFDDNRFNECAPGIHFFITRQEAVNYGM